MRIEYDSTLGDHRIMVERLAARHGIKGSSYRKFLVTTLGTTVLFVAVLTPVGVVSQVAAAAAMLFGGLVILPIAERRVIARRLDRLLIEQRGTSGAMPHSLELRSDGLQIEYERITSAVPWSEVEDIARDKDAVVFWFANGGLAIVARRVFDDEVHEREFMSIASRFRQEATSPAPGESPSAAAEP